MLIAFPAILPVTQTPRTFEARSGATTPQLLVADADAPTTAPQARL